MHIGMFCHYSLSILFKIHPRLLLLLPYFHTNSKLPLLTNIQYYFSSNFLCRHWHFSPRPNFDISKNGNSSLFAIFHSISEAFLTNSQWIIFVYILPWVGMHFAHTKRLKPMVIFLSRCSPNSHHSHKWRSFSFVPWFSWHLTEYFFPPPHKYTVSVYILFIYYIHIERCPLFS